ncbi:MAG: toluene hydroxylase [Proteobacteria bacterium]|nr:toluene hydroxylase [Pseudomonadota bacterium]
MTQKAYSGAAGSSTFAGSDSRKYNYFEPAGRRATLYEDVTVDVQPDPSRHLLQGWIMAFADGQPTYGEYMTVIKCADWHVFRAPDQEWSRTHYQRQSHIENTIKMVVDNARSDGAPGRFAKPWVNVLQDHFGALKHAEFGLGVALMKAQRDGLTQMVNNTILTNASYKLRLSQDITLYLGDIGLDITIDGDAGKKAWMEDSHWQATRKAIEAILAASDHMEIYFAVNVVFEALVGEVFRSGFIMRAGPSFNDFVTPAVVSAASDDYRRNLANTLTLLAMVNGDAASGAANKKIMTGWLAKYLPLCLDATAQLKPVWMTTGARGADFGSALADAKTKFSEILAEIDVSLPTGTAL